MQSAPARSAAVPAAAATNAAAAVRVGRRAVEEQRVVDGQLREADDMHDRRAAFAHGAPQFPRRVLLMSAVERQDDPPVPALEIALPRVTAIGLEQLFPRAAELPQVRVAWKDHALGAGRLGARAARNHRAD